MNWEILVLLLLKFSFFFFFHVPTIFLLSPEATLVFLRSTCLSCLIVNVLNEFPLNSLRTMTVHCTFPFFLLISSIGERSIWRDLQITCWIVYWCCKYNLANGFHLANSGTYMPHFVPWLFLLNPLDFIESFQSLDLPAFPEYLVSQLIGQDELVLVVTILFQLPMGSENWHDLRLMHWAWG